MQSSKCELKILTRKQYPLVVTLQSHDDHRNFHFYLFSDLCYDGMWALFRMQKDSCKRTLIIAYPILLLFAILTTDVAPNTRSLFFYSQSSGKS